MKFIDNIINKVGVDKVLHFFGGGWTVAMFSPIGWLGILIGFALMLVISVIKEKFFDTKFDIKDIIAACIGGGISVIVYLLLTLLVI